VEHDHYLPIHPSLLEKHARLSWGTVESSRGMDKRRNLRFLQQEVISEPSRATRLRKEKSGDLVSPFSKIARGLGGMSALRNWSSQGSLLSGGSDG
jgi:hypothetical protein